MPGHGAAGAAKGQDWLGQATALVRFEEEAGQTAPRSHGLGLWPIYLYFWLIYSHFPIRTRL